MDKNVKFYFDEEKTLDNLLNDLIYQFYKETVEIE